MMKNDEKYEFLLSDSGKNLGLSSKWYVITKIKELLDFFAY